MNFERVDLMFCREDQMDIPSQARMGEYIHNPLWDDLCAYMKQNITWNHSLHSASAVWNLDGISSLKRAAERCAPFIPGRIFSF